MIICFLLLFSHEITIFFPLFIVYYTWMVVSKVVAFFFFKNFKNCGLIYGTTTFAFKIVCII